MGSRFEDRPEEGPETLERLLPLLRELAKEAARTCRLPPDVAPDLAQEAFSLLWDRGTWPPTDEQAQDEVRRLAQKENQRRRREAARLRGRPRPRLPARGPPVLCPRLAVLIGMAANPDVVQRTLLAAAATVSRHPGVLDGERFRLFHLAYVEEQDLDEIARVLGPSNRRALQKRLRRLSRRLEGELVRRMEPHFPARSRPRLLALLRGPGSRSEKSKKDASPADVELSEHATHVLEAVIHRDPGSAAS